MLTDNIEEAFLMVSVIKEDRDALRVLWVKDIWKPNPELQVLCFIRVISGMSSSPFLLNAIIDHHMKWFTSTKPQQVKLLSCLIFVDDLVTGSRQGCHHKVVQGSKGNVAGRWFQSQEIHYHSATAADPSSMRT